MKLDILAIGVHPDDVELGCGGTILKQVSLGYKVGILDLTQGELGTRGSAELRMIESDNAGKILGISARDNLKFRDGFFKNDEDHQIEIIKIIRKYQPDVILANAPDDRHPDHGRAHKLTYDAWFLSGLRKVETMLDGKLQDAWRPKNFYSYIQAKYLKPDFVIDVSEHFDKKMDSIFAYTSQFHDPESREPETFISSPEFIEFVKSRYRDFGSSIGAEFAEGFIAHKIIGFDDITKVL